MNKCQRYFRFTFAETILGKTIKIFTVIIFLTSQVLGQEEGRILYDRDILTGAEQTYVYLPLLEGKNVGVVANQTSMIDNTHLVDSLLS